MDVWRLERVRLWRTRRLIVLGATFLILGLGIPILTYYLPQLVRNAGGGVRIIAPKQTAADAIEGVAGNVGQLGTLVVAIVAAATLSIDARPILAAFYRTRVRRSALLLLPRYVTITAAAVAALAVGVCGAAYETAVLFGAVSVPELLGGFALEALWLCFVTSVVAAFASTIRSVAGAAGATIAALLVLALLGGLHPLTTWLPTRLARGLAMLFTHSTASDVWHPAVLAGAASIALVGLAVRRTGRREL